MKLGSLDFKLCRASVSVRDGEYLCCLRRKSKVPYGAAAPEMLAHDLPDNGWTAEELSRASMEEPGHREHLLSRKPSFFLDSPMKIYVSLYSEKLLQLLVSNLLYFHYSPQYAAVSLDGFFLQACFLVSHHLHKKQACFLSVAPPT